MAELLPELELGQRVADLQRAIGDEIQSGIDQEIARREGAPTSVQPRQTLAEQIQQGVDAERMRVFLRERAQRRWANQPTTTYRPLSADQLLQRQAEEASFRAIQDRTITQRFQEGQDEAFRRHFSRGPDYIQQELARDRERMLEHVRRVNRDRAASAGNGGSGGGSSGSYVPEPPRTPNTSGARPSSPDFPQMNRIPQNSGARVPLDFADPPRPGLTPGWDVSPNIATAPIDVLPEQAPLAYRPRPGVARPTNIPRAIGLGPLARGTAIGGLIDFGISVAMGEEPRRAAAGAIGGATLGAIGTAFGAGVGTFFGGIGAIPGAAIGGFIGGSIAGLLGADISTRAYDAVFPAAAVPYGFLPGQIPQPVPIFIPFFGGQMSGIAYRVTSQGGFTRISDGQQFTLTPRVTNVTGPVRGLQSRREGNNLNWYLLAANPAETLLQSTNATTNTNIIHVITSVVRADGQPDTGGNRVEPAPLDLVRLVPGVVNHPENTPYTDYAPRTADRTQNGQGNAPFWVPSGRPAPGITAPPTELGQGLPQPQPIPGRTTSPAQPGLESRPRPGSRVSTFEIPGNFLDEEAPDNQTPIAPIPNIVPFVRPATNATPSIPPTTPPTVPDDPCQGNSCSQAIRSDIANNRNRLDELNALLNGADLMGLADLTAKLDRIDAKLGAQVPGGLSGFLQGFKDKFDKFVKWSQIDRLLNILTFITTVHNAFMLSNQIGQTLFSAISQGLAVIGIKDEDGNPLDISTLVNESVENIIKTIIGAENYEVMNAQWKRANRIYQAATNILWAFQSIGYSILESLEIVGSYVAKIGNAAKKFGVFVENCYSWMNPNPNFRQNRFFRFLDETQEVVENIDEVAGEILSVQETITEIGTQSQNLRSAIAGVDENGTPYPSGFDAPENVPTATAEATGAGNSQTPPITPQDERAPVVAGES